MTAPLISKVFAAIAGLAVIGILWLDYRQTYRKEK